MLENFPQKLEGKKGAVENFVENQWKICGKSVENQWKIFHTTYLLNLENFQNLWKVVEKFCGKSMENLWKGCGKFSTPPTF